MKKKAPGSGVLREDCFTVLGENNQVNPKRDPKLDRETLLRMYRNMVLTRTLDERGMMLQRQGRIGFYVPSFGQEAIQTGTIAAAQDEDWIFPSYREPGVFLYRDVGLFEMICNLFGNASDICKGRQMPNHFSFAKHKLFSVSSPIATQVIQAVGAAMAYKIRGENQAAFTYFGDGGTSENDFHTGLTFAGAYQAPVVFVCTNNQYAISLPVEKQTGAKRLVDKAIGYGMEGIAVDGNDVLAVYSVAKKLADNAREGKGPGFMECLTLRMGPHSSSDDPTRYRDAKQYEAWKKRDPIVRFRTYLETKGYWSKKEEESWVGEAKEIVMNAVKVAEKEPEPDLKSIFDDVYVEQTPQLKRQYQELLAEKEARGKFENTSEAFPL